MKNKKLIVSFFVTLLILAYLFLNVDFVRFANTIYSADLRYIAAAIIGYLGLNIVLALRLYIQFNRLGYAIPFPRILLFHFSSMILGDVTPGKLGYFGMILLLKKEVRTSDTLSVLTIGQIMDFLLKIIGTGLFIVLMAAAVSAYQNTVLLGVIVVFGMTLIAGLLVWSKRSLRLLKAIKIVPARLAGIIEGVQESTGKLRPVLIRAFILSIAGWIFIGLQWYFLGLAVGINLPFIYFLFLQSIVSTVAFLPVTLSGIGLQESAIIVIIGLVVGSTPETKALILAYSILVRGMSMIIDATLGAFNLRKVSISELIDLRK